MSWHHFPDAIDQMQFHEFKQLTESAANAVDTIDGVATSVFWNAVVE